ncbi:hypothetical protein ABZ799_28910 [Nocardiopsis dassonvillei]|uniref:hypothetical protein n=1 Tax=Nocardiopsis dassonvillei TaxID=2014 RepID=UPI003411EA81
MKTMPWNTKKKDPQDAPPPSEPTHVQEESVLQAESESTSWFTPTRVGVLVASVPSVLSLILMVAVVAEMTSSTDDIDAASVATGVFFDVIVAGLVAIAWFQPSVRRMAGYGAWVGAVAAAALIAWHYQGSVQMLFGSIPLLAKFTWHLTLVARTAADKRVAEAAQAAAEKARREKEEAERRARTLSTGLTPEQEEELASIRRKAAYARAKAGAQSELTNAEAEADRERQQAEAESERIRQETESQMRQEAIQRRVKEQMAMQQANVALLKQRNELEMELRLTRPYQLGSAEEPHSRVPDDPSGFGLPPVGGGMSGGFGFAQPQAHAEGARPADQQVPEVRTQVRTEVHPSQAEAERNRVAVLAAYDRLVQAGEEPTISAVAEEAGVSRRTVTRRLPADKKLKQP